MVSWQPPARAGFGTKQRNGFVGIAEAIDLLPHYSEKGLQSFGGSKARSRGGMAVRAEAADNVLDDVHRRFDLFGYDGGKKRFWIPLDLFAFEPKRGCACGDLPCDDRILIDRHVRCESGGPSPVEHDTNVDGSGGEREAPADAVEERMVALLGIALRPEKRAASKPEPAAPVLSNLKRRHSRSLKSNARPTLFG